MLMQALNIVLSNSINYTQSTIHELEGSDLKGTARLCVEEQIELAKQAHALLEDYIKRNSKDVKS